LYHKDALFVKKAAPLFAEQLDMFDQFRSIIRDLRLPYELRKLCAELREPCGFHMSRNTHHR
jgi:hypothetical protein